MILMSFPPLSFITWAENTSSKKKVFQIFKQMGETQHCVLKVIIIIFFEVFLFLQEFLKERLWWFLALAEFLWKISKSKIKSVFLNKRMRRVTWWKRIDIDVCDILLNVKKSILLKSCLCVSVYDYACGSLCPECCQNSSLLLTLLGCRVFWHKAYTTLIMKNVFKF